MRLQVRRGLTTRLAALITTLYVFKQDAHLRRLGPNLWHMQLFAAGQDTEEAILQKGVDDGLGARAP